MLWGKIKLRKRIETIKNKVSGKAFTEKVSRPEGVMQ